MTSSFSFVLDLTYFKQDNRPCLNDVTELTNSAYGIIPISQPTLEQIDKLAFERNGTASSVRIKSVSLSLGVTTSSPMFFTCFAYRQKASSVALPRIKRSTKSRRSNEPHYVGVQMMDQAKAYHTIGGVKNTASPVRLAQQFTDKVGKMVVTYTKYSALEQSSRPTIVEGDMFSELVSGFHGTNTLIMSLDQHGTALPLNVFFGIHVGKPLTLASIEPRMHVHVVYE